MMNFWLSVLRQLGRNLKQTFATQMMTLCSVTLSVLIFSFFCLIYTNIINFGTKLNEELRLIVYLQEEPDSAMRQGLEKRIREFDEVESITFVSKADAYKRFAEQLGDERDVLQDVPENFLPASVEIEPIKDLEHLNQLKPFSEYLGKLPGTLKVQYGQDWVEKFNYSTKLISIILMLSGTMLILTTIFMVAYTIRLTILGRHNELELLRLVGATSHYIRTPFLLEGVLQGFFGSYLGLLTLYGLYQWIKTRISSPGFLHIFDFVFLSPEVMGGIVLASILLCMAGSYITTQKFLKAY